MSQVSELLKQADLAFAAYAGFGATDLEEDLKDAGMSDTQITEFLSNWTIIDQYTDASGVSATVFQENTTSNRYLAIRGTESPGDINADYILALGFPSYLNPQFVRLQTQVQTWIDNGDLTTGFSIAGHSLGGYLATAIGTWFSAESSEIYTFNSPGVGGLVGNIFDAFREIFGFSDTAVVAGVTNVRGTAGFSAIPGLGAQLSPPLFIETESSLNPIENHSVVGLTDSLAVYNLFATLDTNLNANGITDINNFIKASTDTHAESLETTVDMLGSIFGVAGTVAVGDRNSLYTQIQAIQTSALFESSIGVVSIVDASSLSRFDQSNTVEGYAYRYALVNLTPFAVSGNSELYLSSEWGMENFTSNYLEDRAYMLDRLIEANTADVDYVPQVNGQSEYFYDYASDTEVLDTDFSSVFRTGPLIDSPELRAAAINTIFGDANDNTFAGGGLADGLYGGAGNDTYQVHQGRRAINYCSA